MATLEKGCIFASTCKNAGVEGVCNFTCYPHAFMYGVEGGKGGMMSKTGVPKSYKNCYLDNLPTEADNPKAYKVAHKYISNVMENVAVKQIGLYLFSIPNEDNPFGTGTGKTTTAVTILNHFLVERVKAYLKGEQELESNPVIFIKGAELQNTFNAQFRGNFEMQEQASAKYYSLKKKIKETQLVVFDDIATRGSKISEAFEDELYEILDYRSTAENGATIFTSNVALNQLSGCLGERIASRIAGMTVSIGFAGKDNRQDSFF